MRDWSQHRMIVTVGEGWLGFAVKCGHDPADTTRPCWPHDVEQEPPVPLPAPQGCNLAEWCDSLDPEDWLHGDVDFECGVDVTWSGDGSPEVRLVVGDQVAPTEPTDGCGIHGADATYVTQMESYCTCAPQVAPTEPPMDPLSVIRRTVDDWRSALMTDDELIEAVCAAAAPQVAPAPERPSSPKAVLDEARTVAAAWEARNDR